MLFSGHDGNQPLADTWEWNGAGWTQIQAVTSLVARWGHSVVYDFARARTLLFGGMQVGFTTLADTWEYDSLAPAAFLDAAANNGFGALSNAGIATIF